MSFYKRWGGELHRTGDLKGAYEGLRGAPGWFAEVCKARVRLLQLRLSEASQHLKAALFGALERDEKIGAFQAGLADLWKFELDWLQGIAVQGSVAIHPRLVQVTMQRNSFVELRHGEPKIAAELFRQAHHNAKNPTARATCKIGQACAYAAMGEVRLAAGCVFFAAEETHMIASRLYKGQIYAALALTCKALGHEARAEQCFEAFNRLDIPYVTKDCLVHRYKALYRLSETEERLAILV